MTVIWANTAEGGTPGTQASPANTGGASGDAFDQVNAGVGVTYAFDDAQAHRGELAYKVQTVGATFFYAVVAFPATATIWIRTYLQFDANPANQFTPVRFIGNVGSALRGGLILGTDGRLQVMNSGGGTVGVLVAPIALGQWVRVEAMCLGDPVAGQVDLKLFNDADSFTPTDQLTTGPTINTGGTLTDVWWGDSAGAANVGPYWQDDMVIDDAGFPGPTPSVTPLRVRVSGREPVRNVNGEEEGW